MRKFPRGFCRRGIRHLVPTHFLLLFPLIFSALGIALLVAGSAYAPYAQGQGKTELLLWEHEMDADQKTLDELIGQFEKANPVYRVKRSHYKTEDLRTQFQTAALGGGGADIVLAPNDFAGPFSIMGIIQPVESWAKLDRFFPQVVEAVTDAKGKTWGVPVSKGNHLMLFVNKKLLAKAPETLEELEIQAKKLSNPAKKQYGFAYNLTEPFWFVAFLGAYGERPLNGTTPNLDTPGMVSALGLVRSLKFDAKVVPPDCDYTCADNLFSEGKVAMVINGDWSVKKYVDTLGKDLIIAPLPKSNATGKSMAPMVAGKYLFVNKRASGAKLEGAKAFSEFMVSSPTQELLLQKSKILPSLKAMEQSPVLKSDPTLAASFAAMGHGQPMPMAVEMRAVWDAIRPQLQEVMAGRAEPKLAAKAMQKDAVTKIREMKE